MTDDIDIATCPKCSTPGSWLNNGTKVFVACFTCNALVPNGEVMPATCVNCGSASCYGVMKADRCNLVERRWREAAKGTLAHIRAELAEVADGCPDTGPISKAFVLGLRGIARDLGREQQRMGFDVVASRAHPF